MSDFEPNTFGKYFLIDRIAVGGMAEIYKAKQFGIGGFEKLLVIKKILPHLAEDKEFVEMFIDEALIAVNLSHSNITQVYELGQIENTYFIAMEFIDGKNLREIQKKCSKININVSIDQAIFVISEICKGLDYAHRKKKGASGESLQIIHRDISPQNIMISYEGEIKITDFGIAKAKGKLSKTQAGVLKGKFGYMSPEQAKGKDIDFRSDVFSTGIILWEMLTSKRLFLGDTDFDTLKLVQEKKIPPPSEFNKNITKDLDEICLKALNRDPDKRYQSASDLQKDLSKELFSISPDFTPGQIASFMKSLFVDEIKEDIEKSKGDDSSKLYDPNLLFIPKSKKELGEEEQKSLDDASKDRQAKKTSDKSDEVDYKISPASIASFPERTELTTKGTLKKRKVFLIAGLSIFIIALFITILNVSGKKPQKPKDVFGYITLETEPVGANIIIDAEIPTEVRQGISPWPVIKLKAGQHKLKIEKDGFRTVEDILDIKKSDPSKDQIEVKKYTLAQQLTLSDLYIESTPSGASVFIDDQDTSLVTPCTIPKLESGKTYSLMLKKSNYQDYTAKVEILPNTENKVFPQMQLKLGRVMIYSTPSGAEIFLNDQKYGTTPLQIPGIIPNKKYSLVLKSGSADYYPAKRAFTLNSTDDIEQIHIKLEKKPAKFGKALVQAIPWAYIYVDGNNTKEQTPAEIKIVVGKHTLELRNPNFQAIKKELTVKEDQRFKIKGNMKTGEIELIE